MSGSSHVLVTHNDLSSDLSHGKDSYGGLVDVTKGSDLVTVSWNVFHHHAKVMLVSASDDDGAADTGVNSRMGARVLLQANVFRQVRSPSLTTGFSAADGSVTLDRNHPDDAGGATLQGTTGPAFSLPYRYAVDPAARWRRWSGAAPARPEAKRRARRPCGEHGRRARWSRSGAGGVTSP